MKTLEIFILSCLLAEFSLLVYLVISARAFVRKMTSAQVPGGFKSNIYIESALSMDL